MTYDIRKLKSKFRAGHGTGVPDPGPGLSRNIVSQGIWHPRVKFPRDFGIPTGNLAPP